MSERILFTDGWLFHEGDIAVDPPAVKAPVYTRAKTEGERRGPASFFYEDRPNDYGKSGGQITHERWENVTLPHDYIIRQTPKETGNNALGFFEYPNAWYRKHFVADEAWRGQRVELEFCGVMTTCKVYFNGVYLHYNETAFTPFTVDITDFIRFDGQDNLIAVFVSPERPEGWWYAGAGITRTVWLSVKNKVAVARYGVSISPRRYSENVWEVPISITLENTSGAPAEAQLRVSIEDAEGITCVTSEMNGSITV